MFCLVRCNKIGGSTPTIKIITITATQPIEYSIKSFAQHTNILFKNKSLFIYLSLSSAIYKNPGTYENLKTCI